jgi:hypothetical protein
VGEIEAVSQPGDLIGSPAARGYKLPETNINFQEITAYLEWAPVERFSVFVETPVRFVNPEVNAATAGFGDMNAGFKWAFLYEPDRVMTFQLRSYFPTGDPAEGLGTNHYTLEPSLLYFRAFTEYFTMEAQLGDWIPIGGTDFAGNVLEYGIGFSYHIYETPRLRITPVIELLGWTVLGGKETASLGNNVFEIQNAAGNTIVNAKFGVRVGLGESQRSDFYAGYGQALTGDVWYREMFRVEYRFKF